MMNLFKRRWMKVETGRLETGASPSPERRRDWRKDTWTVLCWPARGGGGRMLSFWSCFCFKKKSINQPQPLMVHCHFQLPLGDFPTANVTFFCLFFFRNCCDHNWRAVFLFFPSFSEQLLRLRQRLFRKMLQNLRAAQKTLPNVNDKTFFFVFFTLLSSVRRKNIYPPISHLISQSTQYTVQDAAASLFLWVFLFLFLQLILPFFF